MTRSRSAMSEEASRVSCEKLEGRRPISGAARNSPTPTQQGEQ